MVMIKAPRIRKFMSMPYWISTIYILSTLNMNVIHIAPDNKMINDDNLLELNICN